MDDADYEASITFLIGAVSLVLLLFLMGIIDFYSWVATTLISYCASVFFIIPIALGIIQRQFPREYIVLMIFGVSSLIVYAFLFNMTAHDIAVDVVQTVIILTIVSVFFTSIKRFVEKKIPP